MSPKTIPMSVRLSDDDATFVATLDIEGATTPSDKLRALVSEARQRREGVRDHMQCHAMVRDLISPAMQRLREAEREQGQHSRLLTYLADWLPDAIATLITPTVATDAQPIEQLRLREQLVVAQVFLLIEDVIRMGVTRESRCYDKQIVRKHLEPTLELARLIDATRSSGDPPDNGRQTHEQAPQATRPQAHQEDPQ